MPGSGSWAELKRTGLLLRLLPVRPHQPTTEGAHIATVSTRPSEGQVQRCSPRSPRTLLKSVLIQLFLTFSFVKRGQNSACICFLRKMRTIARDETLFLVSSGMISSYKSSENSYSRSGTPFDALVGEGKREVMG
jgi:hypothetical protein